MWMLVLVWIHSGVPSVEKIGTYESIYDCFNEFELLEDTLPEEGTQLVCIKGEMK